MRYTVKRLNYFVPLKLPSNELFVETEKTVIRTRSIRTCIYALFWRIYFYFFFITVQLINVARTPE